MNKKEQQFKNARILTSKEMKELKVFETRPEAYCPQYNTRVECPSGTKNWQIIHDGIQPVGIRCDDQIKICNGSTFSGSGSGFSISEWEYCPNAEPLFCLGENGGYDPIDEVLFRQTGNPYNPTEVAGIRCGDTYRFCGGGMVYGGDSGSTSGSGGSGSGGSGSGSSGSGSWPNNSGSASNQIENLL